MFNVIVGNNISAVLQTLAHYRVNPFSFDFQLYIIYIYKIDIHNFH